jgi:hypothetical protein
MTAACSGQCGALGSTHAVHVTAMTECCCYCYCYCWLLWNAASVYSVRWRLQPAAVCHTPAVVLYIKAIATTRDVTAVLLLLADYELYERFI